MIRKIHTLEITKNIKEMCIEANYYLSADMKDAIQQASQKETTTLGKNVMQQLQKNLIIAADEKIPICQDTGMAVVFLDIGQGVHIQGDSLENAINEGIRRGYEEGYLRKSIVHDPLIRKNTKDNTPAVIHSKIVAGNTLKITVAPKGFGSENISRIFMLKPSDGKEGVIKSVLQTIQDAGANACPPIVVGIGIGGTFEKCAIMAKEALLRNLKEHSDIPYIAEMEQDLLEQINCLGIGPGGLGGNTTALAVNINTYPTHIAGLPVGINICCHVNRHVTRIL
ncbi:MAG: fumarate hydratase [Lachnospiraceae bacterium]|nr:fumarate hydratase [Lachnospiraceae bacterium]